MSASHFSPRAVAGILALFLLSALAVPIAAPAMAPNMQAAGSNADPIARDHRARARE
jgi:hypothetical protein